LQKLKKRIQNLKVNTINLKTIIMKKLVLLTSGTLLALLFMLMVSWGNYAFSESTPGDYVRPLVEYESGGTTKYCCKNTQYSSCSASIKCSDVGTEGNNIITY
jgi:hypothetical protein